MWSRDFLERFENEGKDFIEQHIIMEKKEISDDLFFECPECSSELHICRIQYKRINNAHVFTLFTYYCSKCKLTYFIFKIIKKEVKKKRWMQR